MSYSLHKITEEVAREILSWTYLPPYDLYNSEVTEEALQEFAENPYYALYKDGALVGFYCTGYAAQVPIGYFFQAYPEGYLDIGLGMRPDLTGRGQGTAFLQFIIASIETTQPLRLTVAAFNKRAIALYEKFGFHKVSSFTNANDVAFWVMTREE
ncbi:MULTISPECIES: GNAT family N-acetyltransferase [unclassified Bacillus (in: firmicutes)]|uniref:GNAT family N-acetyltransferase n=1 Tax=unclassified Bacillus (in: firmicutes) TaxID=185979 RepID=UPI0004E0CE6C|nr:MULTISPECIES: GNAT family N-acetyltransferase [unclassified Bacillus (in: firmicutes)]